jgi:hypothetical protein
MPPKGVSAAQEAGQAALSAPNGRVEQSRWGIFPHPRPFTLQCPFWWWGDPRVPPLLGVSAFLGDKQTAFAVCSPYLLTQKGTSIYVKKLTPRRQTVVI